MEWNCDGFYCTYTYVAGGLRVMGRKAVSYHTYYPSYGAGHETTKEAIEKVPLFAP